jgi:hypothetical protein
MFMDDPETTRVLIPGQKIGVKVRAVSQSSTPVTLEGIKVEARDGKDWAIKSTGDTHAEMTKNKPF